MRHQAWQRGGDSDTQAATTTDADYALPTLQDGTNPRYVAVIHRGTVPIWIKFGQENVLSDEVGFLLNGNGGAEPQKFLCGGSTYYAITATAGAVVTFVTPLAD